jgi:hypothetical protein
MAMRLLKNGTSGNPGSASGTAPSISTAAARVCPGRTTTFGAGNWNEISMRPGEDSIDSRTTTDGRGPDDFAVRLLSGAVRMKILATTTTT